MDLLADYVQPLTDWLQQNPRWSLFIIFLISLSESLAIVGSIVPGSVIMTAVGILAGSGIIRVDLTLLAAILGAVVGDSLSYFLGYIYSDHLLEIWPFYKYPKWIQYGKDFFTAHGGKSVLIGRFIGPLRSIIPVIAGILHMKQWRFLVANILSAIGWAFVYVMPGVIIGAASHELSTENATRLFMLILIFLASIWLLSQIIKWLVSKLNFFWKKNIHSLWGGLRKKSTIGTLCNLITPYHEKNHYTTASLAFITLFCLFCFIIIMVLSLQKQWLNAINLPIHLLFQSVHTVALEGFFIFCTQLTSTTTTASIFFLTCLWFIYNKNTKAIIYLTSLMLSTYLFAKFFNHLINVPRPTGLLVIRSGSSFPAINLMMATACYGFILFYINSMYSSFKTTLKSFVFAILGLSGLGTLYLGDHWFTDILASYFFGTSINLFWCLIYRKNQVRDDKIQDGATLIFSLFLGIFIASGLATYFNFNTLSYNHTPYHREFIISEDTWWNQQKPILAIYRLNRLGKRISLFNIEYSGDLNLFEKYLTRQGWQRYHESFFSNLLTRINNQSNPVKLPLLTQLYENKPPSLMMLYKEPNSKIILELRIWESNYSLSQSNKPLWIGSIHPSISRTTKSASYSKLINPLSYLFTDKNPFLIKKIVLTASMIKPTLYPAPPYIILIKKNDL
jgi:membrane protein DedA with SNARE-associated domain/membrane-associated phospholipid phosphatase